MFQKWREGHRLKKEIRQLRSENEKLRSDLRDSQRLTLERDFAWADRFLTGVVKTVAISDEAKSKAIDTPDNRAATRQLALDDFMAEKRETLRDYGIEAGLTGSHLDAEVNKQFRALEAQFLAEFDFTQ